MHHFPRYFHKITEETGHFKPRLRFKVIPFRGCPLLRTNWPSRAAAELALCVILRQCIWLVGSIITALTHYKVGKWNGCSFSSSATIRNSANPVVISRDLLVWLSSFGTPPSRLCIWAMVSSNWRPNSKHAICIFSFIIIILYLALDGVDSGNREKKQELRKILCPFTIRLARTVMKHIIWRKTVLIENQVKFQNSKIQQHKEHYRKETHNHGTQLHYQQCLVDLCFFFVVFHVLLNFVKCTNKPNWPFYSSYVPTYNDAC